MIEITQFTLEAPDSDGEMRPETEVEITNATDETIRQIRHTTVFLGHDGGPINFNTRNSEDVALDPGESTTISPYGWLKGSATAGGRDDVTMVTTARLMKRNFIKLGSIDTPAVGSSASKVVTVDSDLIESEVMINVSVDKPDDDGDCRTEVRVLVKNATGNFMEDAQVKVQLIDEEDAQIEDTYCDEHIPANGQGMFDLSFWGVKKSQLRDTSVKINLYIYADVDSGTAERVSEPE